MKRPLLILIGSLILSYGVAFERASTYEQDIRTISKTVLYGPPTEMDLQYDGPDYYVYSTRAAFQTHPVGEHGQLSEHSKHKITLYFWEWFIGVFITTAIILNILSKGDDHE